ncbi:MAG: thiamine pyrophosphate-binding protein [Candidatus Omnitrophica bacterium]|nr:thiamine pyrophosphate-binding protein [Candidatus Omnitrophota bacterium]
MRLCDYIAQFLVKQGVKDIFMLTGYGAMYMNDAIQQSGIKYYATRNEATAPMMAEAYARVRQSLGAVCVTAGPGATNAIPGLAEAFVDSAPILVLSGQVESRYTTHKIGIPGLRTFGSPEINIVPIVQSLTKFAAVVEEPSQIRYLLEKAVYYALSGRPGPVWLDVPLDMQQMEIDPSSLKGFVPTAESNIGDIDKSVKQAFEMLSSAKKPLIIAGHGIRQACLASQLRSLVETLKVPVIFSRFGQDLMPHSHPFVFGHGGGKGSRYCKAIMNQADVVVSLGCRLAPQFTGHDFEAFAKDVKIIMVDIDPAELEKPGIPLALKIRAHLRPFMDALLNEVKLQPSGNWESWVNTCREFKQKNPMVTVASKRNPIDLYYFMYRLGELSGKNHVLVTDAGSNYYVGGQVWNFESGQREIMSGTNAAMGTSIPLAIGAAVAAPDSQILAVTGDGSLELNIQELKTISHYKLNLKLFVINNGGYASMRKWQDTYFDGRRIDTEESTGAGTLNLKQVAKAFDLEHVCIERYEDIDVQLKKIMSDDRPLFVEVMTDNNQKIFEAFKDKDG